MYAISDRVDESARVKTIPVVLSNELVGLLSENLYQSPVKAIEELVVNSFDANASRCLLAVKQQEERPDFIAVLDDGDGMDADGLAHLWRVGASTKREHTHKRKQIGKFGIGKLATYALARRVTWISRTSAGTYAVKVNYADFGGKGPASVDPVDLPLVDLKSIDPTKKPFKAIVDALGLPAQSILESDHWTLVVLEEIRPEKWTELKYGRLVWVLRTAMPLRSDFKLFLNASEVESSKEGTPIIKVSLSDLSAERLRNIAKTNGEEYQISNGGLVSPSFPQGIIGTAEIFAESLYGKSDDLARSGGFFVRAHERLISEDDPLFGISALTHKYFNRFRADVSADDLDEIITAPREGVRLKPLRTRFQTILRELFNLARERFDEWLREDAERQRHKPEHERNRVALDLVQLPMTDALRWNTPESGSDADRGWFYLQVPPSEARNALLRDVATGRTELKFKYGYSNLGSEARMVIFSPVDQRFTLNLDHEFVAAYHEEDVSKLALEDVVTAEAFLEVYLAEAKVPSGVIGEILERRDALLRSLVQDHPRSLSLVARRLRSVFDNERELEMLFVAAARAVGFVSKHIGGANQPDGLARYNEHPNGERVITLESKASKGIPSLSAIDFATLARHRDDNSAQGIWLVAPRYPGSGDQSAVAKMAVDARVSCWTVEDVARVVESSAARQITARQILEIVLRAFTPEDVRIAVDKLLSQPAWDRRALYAAIVRVLRQLDSKLTDAPRSASMIAALLATSDGFDGLTEGDVRKALAELAAASQGLAFFSGDVFDLYGSLEDLERRISGISPGGALPLGKGAFREPGVVPSE